ncbi:glycosyltransferase [Candidatus Bathyarchaeota archaeon]|nr:glycosyltransferase [Candidatus Bathyarchaeota archaeon]
MDLRVCFLALEYFGWGRFGGIGKATKDIAEGLAERGLDVYVVTPLSENHRENEEVNGVKILGYPLWKISPSRKVFKEIDADVYHSQDPSPSTVFALRSMPDRIHLVTFQNPKSINDWSKVNRYYRPRRLLYNNIIEPLIRKQIRRCNRLFCQANYTLRKAKEIYCLESEPLFLPNPISIPEREPCKSRDAMILFLGRLDGEKNPERFIELSANFPGLDFFLAGQTHSEKRKKHLGKLWKPENMHQVGFVEGVLKDGLLERSWVLVNTSVSECLPVSFLEALSNRCSILSNHDPDGLTSRFGFYTPIGDFENGLEFLLDGDRWRDLGNAGFRYVKENHEIGKVLDLHLEHYTELSKS